MATPGQIAVITGAGSGIGRASAHCLLEDGWTVVLAGRRKHMLEETATLAKAICAINRSTHSMCGSAASTTSWSELMRSVRKSSTTFTRTL